MAKLDLIANWFRRTAHVISARVPWTFVAGFLAASVAFGLQQLVSPILSEAGRRALAWFWPETAQPELYLELLRPSEASILATLSNAGAEYAYLARVMFCSPANIKMRISGGAKDQSFQTWNADGSYNQKDALEIARVLHEHQPWGLDRNFEPFCVPNVGANGLDPILLPVVTFDRVVPPWQSLTFRFQAPRNFEILQGAEQHPFAGAAFFCLFSVEAKDSRSNRIKVFRMVGCHQKDGWPQHLPPWEHEQQKGDLAPK